MKSPRIRVFLADDHPMVRRGLAATLSGERDMECVGEADNGPEAVRLIQVCRPDVALLGTALPRLDGIGTIAALRAAGVRLHCLLLASLADAQEIRRAFEAGASGYVGRATTGPELLSMIRNVRGGHRVMSAEATEAMVTAMQQPALGAELTAREHEVLQHLAQGLGNQRIALRLGVSLPTVKFHITNLLSKLQASNRTDAVRIALQHHLV